MHNLKRVQKDIFAALIFNAIFISVALAAPATVNPGVPGTNANDNPAGVIANVYQFALLIGGLLAFGAIVYGAIRYTLAAGNPSGQSEGREWIQQAIIGLILLLGAYLVLYTINPGLVNLELPKLEKFTVVPESSCPITCGPGQYCAVSGSGTYSCTSSGPTGGTAGPGTCSPVAGGPATPAELANSCFGSEAAAASQIANAESGGEQTSESKTDRCRDGNSFSIGLFQINLVVHTMAGLNCPAAFICDGKKCGLHYDKVAKIYNCTVTDYAIYSQCVDAAKIAANNIAEACKIRKSEGWNAWTTNGICHVGMLRFPRAVVYNSSIGESFQ